MPQVTIEKVDSRNFHEFIALVEQLAEYEHLAPPDESAKVRLRADALSDHPKYEAYLGSVGGKTVAYVTFLFTYSTFLAHPTLYLEDIFVISEYRGLGIGKAMFDLCRRTATEQCCGRIEWLVLNWNEPAIRFYEKAGGKRQDWYFYRLNLEQF